MPPAIPITAYLDTCVISGLAKGDLRRTTVEALLRVLELRRAGLINLMTSSVAHEELAGIPELHRTPHLAIYMLLEDVPIAKTHITNSGLLLMGVGGGSIEDPLLTRLRALLPDQNDARHIFQAAKNDAEYFLTADERSIVRFAKEISECCRIQAVTPEQLKSIAEA